MKSKIIGIFVCMLVIGTTIPSIGAMTIPTTLLMKEPLFPDLYPTTPPDSPGNFIGIRIWAKVIAVDDSSNLLEGKIKVDDKITGKYIYDAETPDFYPGDPKIGLYMMNYTPCGFEIKVGELVFKTDPNEAITVVYIVNDFEYQEGLVDAIEVLSVLDFPLSQELLICYADLLYWDSTATALSSIALPTTAPVLRKWEDKTLRIMGVDPNAQRLFIVTANVTLAIKQYGTNLQAVKSVIEQSLITIPTFVHIPFVRFWVKVVERFPHVFPTLRYLLGY